MIYTVVWTLPAEAKLAELWLNAQDRDAITRASHQIEQDLRNNPHTVGESRSGDNRILFCPPLSVLYFVNENDRKVVVWAVWQRS